MQQNCHPSNEHQKTGQQDQPNLVEAKPLYQSPHMILFGTVAHLTRGSGGDYNDECTSGKQPGDDE